MEQESHLTQLYVDVFGEEPSPSSKVALRRMQAVLGLKREDTFSRMLIVQLRSADQIEETRLKLEGVAGSIAPLLASARSLAHQLQQAAGNVAQVNQRIPLSRSAAVHVDVHRKALPLVSYITHAFRLIGRHTALNERERIVAAQWDLLLLVGVLALVALLAAGLQRLFG